MGFTSKVKSKSILNNVMAQARTLDGKEAEAGFYDKIHPEAGISYAALADMQEYGTVNSAGNRHIPSRAFMTQAYHDMMADHNLSAHAFVNSFYGTSTTNKELKKLAQKLALMIRASIERGDFKELSPITIRLKGGDTTILQESGRLINNIRNDVVDKV